MARFLACTGRFFAVLVLCACVSAAFSQTTRSPSSASTISIFLGANWSNASGVQSTGGAVATASGNTVFFTDILLTSGYGFSIPSTDIIEGIEVRVSRRRTSGNSVTDNAVELTKDGGTSFTTSGYAKPDNWQTSFTDAFYGGPSELWGTTWTPAEINNSDFGFGIVIQGSTNLLQSVGGAIDHIQITVYHSGLVPITLASFDAEPTSTGTVGLTWSTASELNNDYFTVERSSDGERYEELAVISGSGTTNIARHYAYEDRMPLAGRSYYRIRQTDYDGTFTFSPVEVVDNDLHQIPMLILSPNPSNGVAVGIRLTGLTGTAEIPVAIYAPGGRLITSYTLVTQGEATVENQWFPATPLTPGIYVVRAGPLIERLIIR